MCIVVCVLCVYSLSFGTKSFSPSPPALDCVDLHNSSTQFWVMFSMDNNGMFVCWCMYVNQKDSFPISFHLLSQMFQTLTNSVPASNTLFVPCFYIVLMFCLRSAIFLTVFLFPHQFKGQDEASDTLSGHAGSVW